jgi:hypothetical protein
MPIRASEKHRYPKDWPAISKRIRFERAGGKCEWIMADGQRCNAEHGELIFRFKSNPERWRWPDTIDLGESDSECFGTKVILTVAHLDADGDVCTCRRDTGLKCGIESHLKALCQLHHLRYDLPHHKRNAAKTRRAKKGNLDLFTI